MRSNTSQASSRQGANTARSLAPLITYSGKPRTAEAASSTRSFMIGLELQPRQLPSPRTASAMPGVG